MEHGYLNQISWQSIQLLSRQVTKNSKCERKSQGFTKVSRIPPLGTINICTKCHGSPSNGCDISVWTKVMKQTTDIALYRATPLAWQKYGKQIYFTLSAKDLFMPSKYQQKNGISHHRQEENWKTEETSHNYSIWLSISNLLYGTRCQKMLTNGSNMTDCTEVLSERNDWIWILLQCKWLDIWSDISNTQ